MEERRATRIRQLTCVYRFDAGVRGGAGLLAARVVGDGCPLRALTHHGLLANPHWTAMVTELIVPVVLTHLDRTGESIRHVARDGRPCVLAETRVGAVALLGPADLEWIAGRVTVFLDEVRRAARDAGLTWTMPMWDSSPAPLYASGF
ncbi:hypothetical protein SAMN05421812_104138 [Asanoa hainanensis]|uniref:Uncharacterized protein n=1 Tax=Asanoa hainanensis TaxID=560556 RepID=A0A239L8X6_9ACTN|nr:hypothetical protein [Asanoa hainanensis]SNT27066.1 hypothetical protein SAMN05421812_104138 [Asanoa hainanensis]